MRKMHVLIVYAHPEPTSFNAALRETAVETLRKNGHDVKVSDLYAMKFDPVFKKEDYRSRKDTRVFHPYPEALHACETKTFAPDILAEMEKVRWADLIIFQFPVWFTSWPAIMKGWIDRVFQAGFSFTFTQMYGGGLLKGKKAMLVVTTGSPEVLYSKGGLHGDIHELFTPITKSILEANGLEVLPPFFVFNAAGQTKEEGMAAIGLLKKHLQAV
jgi:NAD(P)H dehydrogenase (quinone)